MKSEEIIKEYNIFNIILITLVIAMIFLPFISRFVNKVFPITYGCLSYRILGETCPLCGFTRDIKNIITGNIFGPKLNLLSVPAALLGISEIFFRVKILLSKKRLVDNKFRNKIIKFDVIYHVLMFFSFIIYGVLFYALDLSRL
ncbi:hypothetical protein [Clostridium subterminale]|uniref:DUF2752 domain-containing protein n=1 Tax=Clostridium subterminale TaxID=1550 RepID=A0ABN1KPX2_CLOSU